LDHVLDQNIRTWIAAVRKAHSGAPMWRKRAPNHLIVSKMGFWRREKAA
jgi:hypothetical protein